MNRSIGWWMLIGLAIACCWVLVGTLTAPSVNLGKSTFVAITAPASLVGRRIPLGVLWFVVLNGGIYASIGTIIALCQKLTYHHKVG